jgi:hypothetical protein
MTTAQEYAALSESDKKKEDWMNSKWRPAMGWLYLVVCSADFVVFPILWSVLQGMFHGTVNSQWQPLTLQGAGLFHIAMGAIIGVAAWGRTQEKLNGANNGGAAAVGTTYVPPVAMPIAPAMSAPAAPAVTPAPVPVDTPAAATINFGGRLGPAQPPQPVL